MPTASAKSNIAPIPAGLHQGVCYAVIDLGTQQSQMFGPKRKVMINWELPDVTAKFDDGNGGTVEKPRVISKEYTLSIGKKATLRADLESWRGRPFTQKEAAGFELANLIGANCQINVTHKPSSDGSRVYSNITSIVPIGRGMLKLQPTIPTMVWDIPKEGAFTLPKEMPEWIQTKIKSSEEYLESVNPHRRKEEPSDDQMANLQPAGPDDLEDVPF